jgi:phenylalanyl-tRNA synthetase beta chain
LSPEGASLPGDAVIDFEITANRPDCLSVIGLSREAATATRLQLRLPWDPHGRPISVARPVPTASAATVSNADVSVTIEDAELCPRFAAAVADVRIGPSPAWLQNRLTAAGVRPISNVVDITNYVLIEMGHPMHAYDLDKLGGRQLRARRATPGEKMRTLDGEARSLDPEMLVIADAHVPQGAGGVMGGAASEVSATTRVVVFEAAYFKPASIRRTSKKLGLKTEASSRFERGADINAPVVAIERALALLEQIGAGQRRGHVLDCYPEPRGATRVALRRDRIARVSGTAVPDADVEAFLSGLGFDVEATDSGWVTTVPTHRVDILREVDLIEELTRHHGYDRVPTTFPALRAMPPRPDPSIGRKALLRHVMTAAGFSEAIGFTFIESAAARPFITADEGDTAAVEATIVPLAYPLSEKFAVLRPSLLPGLVDAVALNRRRGTEDVRLFEIGAAFSLQGGEQRRVACAWSGAGTPLHWGGGYRAVDFFDLKGIVERIGEALGLSLEYSVDRVPFLQPGRTAVVKLGSALVGCFGQLLPAVADAREMPGQDPVYVAELDLEALDRAVSGADTQMTALPRFPSIVRDISVLLDETLPAAAARATIRTAAPETLVSVHEFDRYQGKNIPEGRYSLSLRLTFRSPERTLTDGEVQQAMDRIVEALVREHGAVQR